MTMMRFKNRDLLGGGFLCLCVALAGCRKPKAPEVEAPEAPAPRPAVLATPAPAKAAATTPVPTTPAPKRLAPAGTFFLLKKKSVETADGITGFKPGTQITQQADGSFVAGGLKIEVLPNEITNDLDIAARAVGADAQRQAAIQRTTSPVAGSTGPTAANQTAKPASTTPPEPGRTVPATQRVGSGLDASSALGASHTMTRDGWLWEKNASGDWKRVKPLR
jgi:hypothetical protein